MSSAIEIELKLSASPGAIATLLADPALFGDTAVAREQVSTYFDTAALALHKAGLSLRVRRIADRYIQTVKAESATAASLFARQEWERDIAGDTPELGGGALPLAKVPGAVLPLFVAEARRTLIVHAESGSRIELVADVGRIVAGTAEAPISEIELELLEGDRHNLFAFARTLAERVPLRLGVRSKSERGYALHTGESGKGFKSEPVWLAADLDTGGLFEAIAGACLRHFRLNEDLLLATGKAEPLHQARVALRRLRSALTIFKPMLAGPEHDRLRGELRWLSGLLGEVRNIDVLIPQIEYPAALGLLRQAREHGLAELRDALDSVRVRRLILDLLEWVTVGAWRDDPAVAALRTVPAPIFARDRLQRLRRRLKKRGTHLARLDEAERHEVRIVGKQLRYAIEFFAGLFAGKKAGRRRARMLDGLEKLQTALGELNDLASGRALLERLGVADVETVLVGGKRKPTRKLLADAEQAHEALLDEKRFWR